MAHALRNQSIKCPLGNVHYSMMTHLLIILSRQKNKAGKRLAIQLHVQSSGKSAMIHLQKGQKSKKSIIIRQAFSVTVAKTNCMNLALTLHVKKQNLFRQRWCACNILIIPMSVSNAKKIHTKMRLLSGAKNQQLLFSVVLRGRRGWLN